MPICLGNWAGGGQVTGFGTTVCNAHRHFPDIVGKEHIYKAPAWLFGCLIFGETFRNTLLE